MDYDTDNIRNENFISEEEVPKDGFVRKACVFLTVVFCLVVFGTGIMHYIMPDRKFSESENRVLAEMPALSADTLSDGSFMSDFETYLADQFPLRDMAISVKTFSDRLIGKNKENGVYIGKDGFIFESQTPYSKEKVKELTKSISDFCKKSKIRNKAVLIAPNSGYVYSEKLPAYLKMPSQKNMLKKISDELGKSAQTIDVFDVMRKKAEKDTLLYYRTDHHWTTRGAYTAFSELAKKWKLDLKKPEFEFFSASTTFEGTLSSKAGVHSYCDEVEICVPKNSEGTYVVNYESQQKKTATLFDKNKLSAKNHYELFLGGNFDKVIISTTAQTENSLLLIKDSYANCMIPMLTPYFSKIEVIDPRYLTDSFDGIVKENSFTHVLFLYNMNTFLEDNSLVPCLES